MNLDAARLETFVAGLAADSTRWSHLVEHRADTRVYAQIWDGEDVNAWLICWSPGHDTGFHDHDDAEAAVAVLAGEVREDRLRVGGDATSRVIRAGSVFTVPATAIHRVRHTGSVPAVSIHAYSPPLARTGTYRIDPVGELRREAQPLQTELRAA
jgi:mannose-6-phosphate isomerase-like protein (cupin superfamily)